MPGARQAGKVNLAISVASLITYQEGQIAAWSWTREKSEVN